MIGVVVWSNISREKAIIWCEDHATLAYLKGRANLVDFGKWPEPGDLVELETKTVGNLRHALNVSMISEQACPELPRMLTDAGPATRQPHLRVVNGGASETGHSGQITSHGPLAPYGDASNIRAARSSIAG
ncbi:MAG: hypothetical protein L0G27_01795 [Paracoccus sp. (in: a-proteobacteria)]|nr:hypothetical protein [Paracoccus sp. (in: a-proteobacteria)]